MLGIADVCAIIVTYHPDETFPERFAAVSGEVAAVFIVDNGSSSPTVALLSGLVAKQNHALISNGENLGIATALNQGVRAALNAGFKWAITLDQDSTPERGMVGALLRALEESAISGSVAVVAPTILHPGAPESTPVWLRPNRRLPLLFERVPAEHVDAEGVTMAITSGALTNLVACRNLGFFWDDLFIDFVDFEYCLRARRAGYRILIAKDAVLWHRLGNRQLRTLAGRQFAPLFHDASRIYYIWRNRVAALKRHGIAFPHWALYELASAAYWILRILLFEDQRLEKVHSLLRGTIHGLRGQLGHSTGKAT